MEVKDFFTDVSSAPLCTNKPFAALDSVDNYPPPLHLFSNSIHLLTSWVKGRGEILPSNKHPVFTSRNDDTDPCSSAPAPTKLAALPLLLVKPGTRRTSSLLPILPNFWSTPGSSQCLESPPDKVSTSIAPPLSALLLLPPRLVSSEATWESCCLRTFAGGDTCRIER